MTSRKGIGGRPTKYDRAFCPRLVEHMKKGGTFEMFGAECGVCKDTLYMWLKRHREFADARKAGYPHLEKFYVQLGLSIATGQMRRVSAEEPMLDAKGRVLRDETGQPLMRREYEPARPNANAWIFLTKNLLKWRDRADLHHGGQVDGVPIETRKRGDMTREERLAAIEALRRSRLECGDD